jgi:ectoine hydroxylase-related dioxygenase (phytanoyl-CoA dioxygenase family)
MIRDPAMGGLALAVAAAGAAILNVWTAHDGTLGGDEMRLTDEQKRAFEDEGVLVVEGVLTPEDLAPLKAEYTEWIDRHARQLAATGRIANLHEDAAFEKRLALLYAQSPQITHGMDVAEVRGPASFELMRHPALLDTVEGLVGPEITCNPIQHIRAKPPAAVAGSGAGFYNVPWHQDAGVITEDADSSNIVTCWLALVDATVENGCMEVLPGAHRLGFLPHMAGPSIIPEAVPDLEPRPVPVKQGGVVFMHRHTPHRSTPNLSDHVRWSLDLRYQPTGAPTGRSAHPDFIARSQKAPSSVLTDAEAWSALWQDAFDNPRGEAVHRTAEAGRM